tara:strand:- start:14889 stop:15275 length:387 start_codon:yes stop_codon:yes gene_type:complete
MNKTISTFLLRITLIIGLVFIGHLFVLGFLEFPLFNDKIVLAYVVNTAFAIIVFTVLFLFREKFKNRLGFLFIFASTAKFALFLILFNTSYKSDGIVSKTELFAFFIPYFFTLSVEIFSLSKWLNKLE